MPLRLKVKGATKEELARGVDAAVAYLKMHDVTPTQADDGMWEAMHADIPGMEDSSRFGEREQRWARLWLEARSVALKACCRGWEEIPLYADMEFYTNDRRLNCPVAHAANFARLPGMCNLYNITTNQEAIRDLSNWDWSSVGNLEPSLDVYPDRMAPIVRNVDGKRELANVRWGLPSSQKAQLDATSKRADKLRAKGKEVDEAAFADLLRMEPDKGTTNVRNTSSKHWRRWLAIENRCVVPATSFAEPDWRSGSFSNAWFALSEERPLFFFAGIWVPQWKSVRKVKDGLTTDDLYGFLTTEPNDVVAPVHQKAMPVILTTKEEIETWLTAPWEEAGRLQRPLPDDMLTIVDAPAKVDDEQPEQRTLL